MTCPKCGANNSAGSNFCNQCGQALMSSIETTKVIAAVVDDATSIMELDSDELGAISQLPEDAALLIVQRGSGAGARYLLDSEVTSVGRHPDSDIFLDDITVSRHHARFVRRGAEMMVEDLGSLNGTYVNRTLVDGSAVLRLGDEVQIGKFRLVFFVGEHGLR